MIAAADGAVWDRLASEEFSVSCGGGLWFECQLGVGSCDSPCGMKSLVSNIEVAVWA